MIHFRFASILVFIACGTGLLSWQPAAGPVVRSSQPDQATATPTPTPTTTPTPTPGCEGWEPPYLELRLEPEDVRPWQGVDLHMYGHGLGFDRATIVFIGPDGQRIVQHWRHSGGWVGRASMRVAAPATAGDWGIAGSGNGEIAVCEDGVVFFTYGSASTREAIPLTVAGGRVFLPELLSGR